MDIEKMSSIDISQENIKSITDKCHQLQQLQKQYKEKEEELSKIKSQVRDNITLKSSAMRTTSKRRVSSRTNTQDHLLGRMK